MEITYRKASREEADAIFTLIKEAVVKLDSLGINQWDEIYPAMSDVVTDLEEETLYVGVVKGEIAVIFSLNGEYDDEYLKGEWTERSGDYQVVHRLIVRPSFQQRGIAKDALSYIHTVLREQGCKSVRLDTFTENPYSIKAYTKMGYNIVGVAHFRKGMFHLMEKIL